MNAIGKIHVEGLLTLCWIMGHKNIPLTCIARARMSKILNNPNLLVDKF